MIKKLLPKSLIAKISAVIFIGLTFELIVAAKIFSSERHHMMNSMSSDNAVRSVQALANILNHMPPDLHQSIVAACQSESLILTLNSRADIGSNQRPDLSSIFGMKPSSTLQSPVRITSSSSMQSYQQYLQKANRILREQPQKLERLQSPHEAASNTQISGSVMLNDGIWLNFDASINEAVNSNSSQAIISLLIIVLLTVSAMYFIIKKALSPVKGLAIASQKMGQEHDFTPLKADGPAEILPTINAFNKMQLQMSNFIEDRTKMLAAISHDLRTPITSLRLRLEFIEESEDRQQMLKTVDNMEAMIKATLNFAHHDLSQHESQPVELTSLINTIIEDYPLPQLNIQFHPTKTVYCRLSPISFRRVIENIINNSLQYGKDNQGMVNVVFHCQSDTQHATITITDNGCGIDESLMEDVFKPFVRLDQARDTSGSSVGLGLSICRSIIRSYGGDINLSNADNGGLTTVISLPLYHDH
ncbi:Adaptive-response sensory-kinase SasA [Sinobacterium norvegicum]|uniref:histidine kinase n=1 Tax=Sinobacterium norvegicum TaxID=1641715 RepID=A0ABM9AGA7_9GAMM|nr:ATP-binding protein [Sinobacterium norvegicum]CAH0991772.1 Adaptive-response sensory-kinase SasA [Sinobacterium norvegicum]